MAFLTGKGCIIGQFFRAVFLSQRALQEKGRGHWEKLRSGGGAKRSIALQKLLDIALHSELKNLPIHHRSSREDLGYAVKVSERPRGSQILAALVPAQVLFFPARDRVQLFNVL